MDTGVYADILLVINYIVNIALIACTAKIAGRKPRRRRIVAAALFGSVSSLTIFLPFMGVFLSLALKLSISAGIILIAFRWISSRVFFKEYFLFFAVSFGFAGVMFALWTALRPSGMIFYNGIVYFDLSAGTLLASTAAAYGVMELVHRLGRSGRLKTEIYDMLLTYGGKTVSMKGLVDTGNALREPFSGIPAVVCSLESIAPLLEDHVRDALCAGFFEKGLDCGIPLRGIPYGDVSGNGLLPAFRPDCLALSGHGNRYRVENCYIAITQVPVGDDRYDALLNPELMGNRLNPIPFRTKSKLK